MARFVHFYPYRVDQSDGGSLRLFMASAATAQLGETSVMSFDSASQAWAVADSSPPLVRHGDASSRLSTFKRRVFPHTLYESGRRAVSALRASNFAGMVDRETIPILHTSYLAPALHFSPARATVLDVYDLVWRGHQIEASRQSPYTGLRAVYAASVRAREERHLARAAGLPVAGWDDYRRLSHLGVPTEWCPTGLPSPSVATRQSDGRVRVGFIGNFSHQATVDSALALLRSPAASSPNIEIVFGGWGSDSREELRGSIATIVGPVARPEQFWDQIDVAAVPVESGTGIKCKIAEAMLAGLGVVTTPLGAAGFDPPSRTQLTVIGDVAQLDEAACRQARRPDPEISGQFASAAATERYRDFLVSTLPPRR